MSPEEFNWFVSKNIDLNIDKKTTWKIISAPGNLVNYHPFVKDNPTLKWPGLNSIDEIFYHNGLHYVRNFKFWSPNVGYDLIIGKRNSINKSFVSWRVHETGNGSSLTITVYPYIFNRSNKLLNYLPFMMLVKPMLSRYLDAISLGLKNYVNTGVRVRKNQFGSHPWFSN